MLSTIPCGGGGLQSSIGQTSRRESREVRRCHQPLHFEAAHCSVMLGYCEALSRWQSSLSPDYRVLGSGRSKTCHRNIL